LQYCFFSFFTRHLSYNFKLKKMKNFKGKKMIDTFPSGHLVTDFAKAKIQVKSGNSLKEIPFGTLNDYLQLIRKVELENKPVAELTVKEFFELSFLTFAEN
jgi:hypothetical protein